MILVCIQLWRITSECFQMLDEDENEEQNFVDGIVFVLTTAYSEEGAETRHTTAAPSRDSM